MKVSITEKFGISATEVIPGAPALLQHIDKRIMVWLRDGRVFIGFLRSVDQFANLVMSGVHERVQLANHYGDIPQGTLLVRGENVALFGEQGDTGADAHRVGDMLAAQVAVECHRKMMDRRKELAYWRRGLVYSAEDYF